MTQSLLQESSNDSKLDDLQTTGLKRIQMYSLVKRAIWASVLDDESVPKAEQNVDLLALRDQMNDIQI